MKALRLIIPVFALMACFAPSASAELVGPLPDLPDQPVLVSGPEDGSVETSRDLSWNYSWNGQTLRQTISDPMQSDYGTLNMFNCSLDGAPAGDCGPTFSATGLSDGAHSFAVNATYLGAVSVCDPEPPDPELPPPCQLDLGYVTSLTLVIDFVVNTEPPTLAFAGGLAEGSSSNQSSQRFPFAAADEGAFATSCSVDGAPASSCVSPLDLTGLPDGPHTLKIVAADANSHSTTITRSFVVDTRAPVASFTGGPAAGSTIRSNHPLIPFAAQDLSSVTYACSFDGAPAVPCASPFHRSKLSAGAHVLVVTPTDAVGNIGPPIVRMFTFKPIKRCVKHKHVRSKHGKQRRVCAKYRLASL